MTYKKPGAIRKNILVLLGLMFLTGVTIYYINLKADSYGKPVIMHFKLGKNNISCHYTRVGDALPSAEDPDFSPRPNSIFFHETSCSGGLNSRQACAVESASRAHPRRQVYVLFSAPVTSNVLKRSSLAKLLNFPNVKVARVHINKYAKNTPLEAMVASDQLNKSQWRVEHTSDVLRYLSLFKWGGLYLDLDMLVVKSLDPLGHNWVVKESDKWVSAAAIATSMDHLGRKLAEALINELKTTFRPDWWNNNGPGVVTRVMKKMCQPVPLAKWSAKTCQGIEVFSPKYIYPIDYRSRDVYFKTGILPHVYKVDNAYTHHLWNKQTFALKVQKDSPYATMAKKYCPTVYEMYGDEFGS